MAQNSQDLFDTVEWHSLEDNETVVVDGEYEIECERYGYDANGEAWLNTPHQSTRGPMRPERVEIQKEEQE